MYYAVFGVNKNAMQDCVSLPNNVMHGLLDDYKSAHASVDRHYKNR